MLISFDESTGQIVLNMRSIGLEFGPFIEAGTLKKRLGLPAAGKS